ncbi:MAG TPA: acylphosphatase [Vicinamibacteria bacterium]|jgi:acylphosphatase
MSCYRYVVRGRVQGVGYRYFVMREASALGVSGFARNLADGSVEVVAEGADEVLQSFEDRLREGPSFAHVSGLDRSAVAPRGDQGFHIR